MTEQTLHPLMKCNINHITYDFKDKSLEIHIDKGDCVDMNGTIEFAKKIDDGVKTIMTYSDSVVDTCYFKQENGLWGVFTSNKSN